MKQLLITVLALGLTATASAELVVTQPTIAPMDYDAMVSKPYYPNLMYPNLSQGDLYQAAIQVESTYLTKNYGEATFAKINKAIADAVAVAKTKAKTKEGQAMFLGEIISRIQQVQNIYGSYSSTPTNTTRLLNYLGYKLSMETINLLYGDGQDLDSVLNLLKP